MDFPPPPTKVITFDFPGDMLNASISFIQVLSDFTIIIGVIGTNCNDKNSIGQFAGFFVYSSGNNMPFEFDNC